MKIRVGISACLLGMLVRYDGGHKRNDTLIEACADVVEWIPVCPESECGLPIPREKMRLQGDPGAPRLIVVDTQKDETDRLVGWASQKLLELAGQGICGFVFKTRSPSCGVGDTKIFDLEGNPIRDRGAGLFARAFCKRFPHLPCTDEGRLQDPDSRERFLRRIR
jgi:uncharacterized protein YbbK (DUF523 family)